MLSPTERNTKIKVWLIKNLPCRRLSFLGMCAGFSKTEMDNLVSSHRQEDTEGLMCDFVERYYGKHQNWEKLLDALGDMEENIIASELKSKIEEM